MIIIMGGGVIIIMFVFQWGRIDKLSDACGTYGQVRWEIQRLRQDDAAAPHNAVVDHDEDHRYRLLRLEAQVAVKRRS